MSQRLPCLILCLLAGFLPACGYRANEVFRRDVKTVHVEMFESRMFRRYLEFYLTEAVKKQISVDTPYRLASREEADTILSGEILEEQQAAFAPDFRTRLPRDIQLTMVVRLQWKDLRTGEVLLNRPVELAATDYLPPAGETEELAQTIALNRMAAQIVAGMYDEW